MAVGETNLSTYCDIHFTEQISTISGAWEL
jgi:hypothetical protein